MKYSPATARGRSTEIDGLRAISVLVVVFGHSGLSVISASSGVTFFFVISGYVITLTLLTEFCINSDFSIKRFFLRRFFKLFPPLVGIILLPSIILFRELDLSLKALISQIFFYFNWVTIYSPELTVLPGSGVTWSLSVEEQFYISIALCWLAIVKISKIHATRLLVSLYSVIYIYSTISRVVIHFTQDVLRDEFGESPRIMRGLDSRMSAIALGGLIAIFIYHQKGKSSFYVNILCRWQFMLFFSIFLYIISYVPTSFVRDTFQFNLRELSIGVVIINVTLRTQKASFSFFDLLNWKFFQVIGICSYSIYLSHVVLIRILDEVGLVNFGLLKIDLVNSIIKIILSVIFGIICHVAFDAPFESKRQKFRTYQNASSKFLEK